MEEGSSNSDVISIEPDLAGAVLAVGMASEMLNRARECFANKDYSAALGEARDSMRLASSALMLRNGHMAGSLDATLDYLSHYYPGKLPLMSWYKAETAVVAKSGGLYNIMAVMLGKAVRDPEQEASNAMNAASTFLEAVRMEMEL